LDSSAILLCIMVINAPLTPPKYSPNFLQVIPVISRAK
jgi:hypothetical protein